MNRQDFITERIKLYRKNPVLFAKEVVCFTPDEWQSGVLMDVATAPKVSVRSGQGVGKTSIEAVIALWFLSCFPMSRVVATAPTARQLNDVLWAELSKWISKSPLLKALLKWTKTKVEVRGYSERWFATARTATTAENMQGFHEDNMLFIIDEASGVSDEIIEAILGTLSGKNNKLLMCGNPTKTSGVFFDSHNRDRALFKTYRVSSLDCPRTNKENINAMLEKYGRNSNFARVRIYGDFPEQEDDVFITLSALERSANTVIDEKPVPVTVRIGCDVARYGDDKTIIGVKVDEKVSFYEKAQGQDTMRTADNIALCYKKLIDRYSQYKGKIIVTVDDGGVGGGVVDRLRRICKADPKTYGRMKVVPVKFGMRIRHRYYYDTTTYMMAVVKELLSDTDKNGEAKPIELVLPKYDDLIAQLSCRKYTMTENSVIKIESKKEMKARGLPSPDEADCVLLLCLPIKKD